MIDEEACYKALTARDRRFDGVFFVGVHSTGVYCRPICPARTPGKARCVFFRTAPEAEHQGFRACFRCRPELAPGVAAVDAIPQLVREASARIREGYLVDRSLDDLARSLGVSARHLRRAMEASLGVSPLALWQSQRLGLARRLLQDGAMRVTDVAFASGFASVRRFNTAFAGAFGCAPSALRRGARARHEDDAIVLRLDHRPPLDWPALLGFLRARAVVGVEQIDATAYARRVSLGDVVGWVRVSPHASRDALVATLSRSLAPRVLEVVERLRVLFDLDARPDVIASELSHDPVLGPRVAARPGLRVAGAFDGWEMAVRAILGQQVSVAAATTLCGRLTDALGAVVDDERTSGERYFPAARAVVEAGASRIADMGIARPRAEALVALARGCEDGVIELRRGCDPERTVARLQTIDGIGPWTAHYIAMRALGWPDAFVANDLVVRRRLGVSTAREAERRAERWRPWRAYGVMHLWQMES